MIEVMAAVEKRLGAVLQMVKGVRRGTYDGEGHDILVDFAVLWMREKDATWGTHAGTIRKQVGEDPSVSLFWGHYDMTQEDATEDFVAREEKLNRII